jgi:formyl-CoA transferase
MANAPAFDAILQARVGLAQAQGDGTKPALTPAYIVDKMAAAMVSQAVLAALLSRERTGIAERVDVAMIDAAAYINYPDVMANRTFVADPPADARNLQLAATRLLRTSDGWLAVAPVTRDQVRRACAVVGHPQLANAVLAIPDAAALTRRLFDELERVTVTDATTTWVKRFTAADVPAAPCLSLDEHVGDAAVVHNRLYAIENWNDVGAVRHVRYPAVFSTWGQLRATSGPPALGEHTDQIFAAVHANVGHEKEKEEEEGAGIR